MEKSKAIKNIIIYIIIFMICMYFVGFFSGKKVYAASSGNKDENMRIIREVVTNYSENDTDWINYVMDSIYENDESSYNYFYDNYMVIAYNYLNNSIYIACSNEPLKISCYDGSSEFKMIIRGQELDVDYRISSYPIGKYSSTGSSDISLKSNKSNDKNKENLFIDGKNIIISEIIYSNYNIVYNNDFEDVGITAGDVFFLKTNKAILFPLMKSLDMGKVTEQVIFLIPISLGLVVSFLALRKVLQALRNLLHQA